MCNSAIAFLLLVAGPVLFLAFRFGGMRSRAIRWALGALILGILITASPKPGFTTAQLDHVKLVLCIAMVTLLSLERGVAAEVRRFCFGVLAAASLLAHFNFFAFHGSGHFTHLHDLAHYYLGSKYADALPYGELYTAIATAELEIHEGSRAVEYVRDLATGAIVPVERVLGGSASIRDRFGQERWQGFRRDVEAIHELMGDRFPALLKDHGYNPTPVWSLVGGSVASLVPAGDSRGIRALAYLDPLLLTLAFGSVLWAFGFETACVAAAYYGILYGAVFDWVGGAFLRNVWFAATLASASLLHRSRAVGAGACLAIAATLRVFPAFLLLSPAVAVASSLARRKSLRRGDALLLASFAAVSATLVLATIPFVGGLARWFEFERNMSAHTDMLSSNFVGLPAWLRYAALGVGLGGDPTVEELFAPAGMAYRVLVGSFFVLSTFVAARLSLRTEDSVARFALGLFPIVFGLQLAHYYYVALILLVLAHRARPARLAMIFGAEALVYVLAFFEIHFSVMCLFRGLIAAYLLVALWFDELETDVRSLFSARAPAGAG